MLKSKTLRDLQSNYKKSTQTSKSKKMLIAKAAKVLTWHKDGKSILFKKGFFF